MSDIRNYVCANMEGTPIDECKRPGFYMIELSTGFIQLPVPDRIRLIEKVKKLA